MEMYNVVITNRAEKDLKKLDKVYKRKISTAIDLLAVNPLLGEKMSGEYPGSYRVKIPPIRIIYALDHKNKIVWVRAVRQRQGAYK